MPIPAHEPVSREWMRDWMRNKMAEGGVNAAQWRSDGFHNSQVPFGGLTRVPFLIWCIKGEISLPCSTDESIPFRDQLHAYDAILYAPGSMVNNHEEKAQTYLRVTMESDLTLYIVSTRLRGKPRGHSSVGFHMRACTLPRPVPPVTLDRIAEMQRTPASDEMGPFRRRCLMDLILADLHDLLLTPDTADWSKPWQTWMEIQAYIRENAHHPLSRKTVADVFGIHPGHVSRLYIRYGHESFNTVLNRHRLARAEALLKTTTLPIAEIAVQSGFTSASYFAWAFRKAYGCAPSHVTRQT
ncbi:MAG: AraC family transcriptional regulator [Verrucomicrobiota bacterium]|nr:AraC family transcriptional regulator [Verrucomicrobiota bacterium]